MYAVTREPMTDSDRESLARSYAPTDETLWLPLWFALVSMLVAMSCGVYVVTATTRDIGLAFAIGFFISGIAVFVFAMWELLEWFGDRHWRAGVRDRYSLLREIRNVEVVHFRASAAWRIPADEFDDIDDKIGVLYRIDGDAFVITPLYEFSLPGSEARVPAEVSMRRTPAPTVAQLTEFVAIGKETLPLLEQLEQSVSVEWALEMGEKYEAGGVLRRDELPEGWRAIV